MTYTIEQIESLFQKIKPQYFKICAGASKGGQLKADSQAFVLTDDKDANTAGLWAEFNEWAAMLGNGVYTAILRSSPEAHKNEKIFTFSIGDGAIGNAAPSVTRPDNTFTSGGNSGILALMFQSMQMQQQQAIETQNRFFEMMINSNNQRKDLELELFKAQNAKESKFADKFGNAIEKHLPVIVNAFTAMQGQPVAIGRATAAPGAQVPTIDEEMTPEQAAALQYGQRINGVLGIVKKAFPLADPLTVLETYIPQAIEQLKTTNNEAV